LGNVWLESSSTSALLTFKNASQGLVSSKKKKFFSGGDPFEKQVA